MRGDAVWLARAIDNLIDNARIHGRAGAPVASRSTRDGEQVALTVTNPGRDRQARREAPLPPLRHHARRSRRHRARPRHRPRRRRGPRRLGRVRGAGARPTSCSASRCRQPERQELESRRLRADRVLRSPEYRDFQSQAFSTEPPRSPTLMTAATGRAEWAALDEHRAPAPSTSRSSWTATAAGPQPARPRAHAGPRARRARGPHRGARLPRARHRVPHALRLQRRQLGAARRTRSTR